MKIINDISGIIRGLKIIKSSFYKNFNESPCISVKFSSEIRNQSKETLKDVIKNASVLPMMMRNAAYLTFVQSMEMVKFGLRSNNEDSGTIRNLPVEPPPKAELPIHTDPIDIELIDRYRQAHPPVLTRVAGGEVPKVEGVADKEVHKVEGATLGSSGAGSRESRERRVPSSEVGRALTFASLFARVASGAAVERGRRLLGLEASGDGDNVYLSEANAHRIVESLCQVRGAALKLGQMLSLQDAEFVHPQLQAIFERVRQHADFMPQRQLHAVLTAELGEDWRLRFLEFEEKPFAAASIGQVHRATVARGTGGAPLEVAVKVQYPGVRRSIDSDINNLAGLLKLARALPAGLHADRAIEVAKKELAYECDYRREASFATLFAEKLAGDAVFSVPRVLPDLSTGQVLTTEMVAGVTLDRCQDMSQAVRDWVGTHMLRLCLTELFDWRVMQTDPNWANFLFEQSTGKIHLLDFGASRHFPAAFVDDYLRVIRAAAARDPASILRVSRRLGFLTGLESAQMERAHIEAVAILGEVFTSEAAFDFGGQSTTRRIRALIPVMLEERLTPPPEETYSLHRKLSGGFLLCSRLRARVSCAGLFRAISDRYRFETEEP